MDLGIPGLEDATPVGRGAFATVYQAHQPAFRRTVAVKLLTAAEFDEHGRQRFERECHALGILSEHPGIVTVHAAGFTREGRPYLIMAFIEEGTLADRLRERGPLPWPDTVAILIRLAGALETAHRSDIIHRDIKPANVLLSQYGAQLSDFGIARIAGGPETRSGVITASVAHASPEVLNGERPSVAADVYSLGSTAYAMLLGQAAFVRDTDESLLPLLMRIQTEPPPDLRARGVPDDLAALLASTLAKDPADRPQSALELGRRLQAVQRAHGQPVTELVLASDRTAETMVVEPITGSGGGKTDPPPVDGDEAETDTRVVVPDDRPVEVVPPADGGGDGRRGTVLALLGGLVAVVAIVVGVALATSGGGGGADPVAGSTDPPSTNGGTQPPVVPPPTTLVGTTLPATTVPGTTLPPDTTVPPETTTTLPPPGTGEPICGPGTGLLPESGEGVRVILDTAVGLGIDDLGALAVLHALADAGEAEILAVMTSAGGDEAAARAIDAVNTYYGRPDLPIGAVAGPAPSGPSPYTAEVAAGFPNDLDSPAGAVELYRQILAGEPDGSVTIASVGFFTNLAGLLASPPDQYSDLTGEELVAAKVKRWVAMGGYYPDSAEHADGAEFNLAQDAPAALSAVAGWPAPAVFSGFQVGDGILTGAALQAATPPENPVREAYRLTAGEEQVWSFDLTAVLAAVRGTAGVFEVCTGRNVVGPGGSNQWQHGADGPHGYLRKVAGDDEIAATLDALLVAPPGG